MPAAAKLPTKEKLEELFECKDGVLCWKVAKGQSVKPGSVAGCLNARGYLVVGIDYRKYLVHRIVWVLHGNEPAPVIDHINGNTQDNRIENLRASTFTDNMCNAKRSKRNSSGIKGVSWDKRASKWVGAVWFKYKMYTIKPFEDKKQCAEAVKILRAELHGEYARHA